ncbi:MAG: MXAN_6640 family putative metalloprotease [Planctomycetota bacterium]|nr:MXAN_6640 family putative metalloprotease [Planctomycetota bacterium]
MEAELIAVFEEGELPLRTCFTPLVHEARLYFALMEGRGRQYASEVLFRPDNYPDYYNGTNIAYPPDTTEVVIRSGDFAVHYVQSGSLSASDQYAQKAANLLPQVKQQYIDMDYTEPPGDGDLGGYTDVYDVYITDLPSGIAGFCSASGTVGNPWPSYVVIDNKLSFEDVRSSTTLSSTLAHEFFHAIQYGYDPAERSWWKETTAVWAQDEIFDDINDYLLLVPYPHSAPHKPLDTADGRTEYGNVVWAKFLEERFPGTDMVRAIWEYQAQNRNTAIPENTMEGIAAVLAQQGYNVDDALGEYANWLYRKELFEEGSEYPSVVVARTVESYPTLVKTASLPVGSLSHLALHLIECEPDDSSSILSMTFDGEDTFPLSVYLLAVDEEGEDLFQKVPLNAAKSGNIILESFGTTYETALFIVLNSSYYRGGAAYDLSLSLQPPGRISLGSDQLSFSSTQGEAPPPRTLAVGNDGDGPLEWNAIPSREWITVEPASGTSGVAAECNSCPFPWMLRRNWRPNHLSAGTLPSLPTTRPTLLSPQTCC